MNEKCVKNASRKNKRFCINVVVCRDDSEANQTPRQKKRSLWKQRRASVVDSYILACMGSSASWIISRSPRLDTTANTTLVHGRRDLGLASLSPSSSFVFKERHDYQQEALMVPFMDYHPTRTKNGENIDAVPISKNPPYSSVYLVTIFKEPKKM